jgi:hypothetical protein
MRKTEAGGSIVRNSSGAATRALRLAAIAVAAGFVMTAGAARAGENDDPRSFSEKFMDGFYSAVRGANMDNRGIDYRERSPLVVPPQLDLPPPAASSGDVKIANWPKDPDERTRKAVIAAKKKNAPPTPAVATTANPVNPAASLPEPVPAKPSIIESLDITNLFGSKKTDATAAAPPGTEPTREALTQPPAGYQMPSPNYPYTAPEKNWLGQETKPDPKPPAAAASSAPPVAR